MSLLGGGANASIHSDDLACRGKSHRKLNTYERTRFRAPPIRHLDTAGDFEL